MKTFRLLLIFFILFQIVLLPYEKQENKMGNALNDPIIQYTAEYRELIANFTPIEQWQTSSTRNQYTDKLKSTLI